MLSADWYLLVRVQQDQGWSPSYSNPPAGWPVGSNTRDTLISGSTIELLPNSVTSWYTQRRRNITAGCRKKINLKEKEMDKKALKAKKWHEEN
jgi:hypothetical protein